MGTSAVNCPESTVFSGAEKGRARTEHCPAGGVFMVVPVTVPLVWLVTFETDTKGRHIAVSRRTERTLARTNEPPSPELIDYQSDL